MKPLPFRKMIKGKVIIAFLVACLALFLAWSVSRVAFNEMLNTFEQFATPNEKLSVVNNLYRRITRLEQLQRSLSTQTDPQAQSLFRRESRHFMQSLDTLEKLYNREQLQTKQIKTMRVLLSQREKLFADYLAVKESIVSNRMLEGEVNNLNELLLDNSRLPDSTTVLRAENRSTTTIIPARKEETPVGLLRRIFGKRTSSSQDTSPQKIINEELNITIDTLTSTTKDSLFKSVDSVLVNLQKKQKRQTGQFVSRERELSEAGNILIGQMLSILEQVEHEVIRQSRANHTQATLLVADSSRKIKLIILAFFLVTAFLVYFILTDISRNNKYRQLLEHANQQAASHTLAKQRFLSNMSHEIRTPLQAILGYAELARQQDQTNKQTMDAIYNSSGHLLQIVNEVLDYSNIISGKFTFNHSVFRLSSLLDEVLSVMKVQAGKKSLDLVLLNDLDDNTYLEGDPFRLKQILYNLLGNAIKFTEHGFVNLSVSGKLSQDKVYLNIVVEDSGIGMTDEDASHIFGEFERRDNKAAPLTSGTGLGLSIVKTLAETQGGRIYVKSELGKGSRFTVYLPFKSSAAPDAIDTLSTIKENPIYPGVVWMVDDDAFILELCSAIFEKNGISHRCFSSAKDLLQAEEDPKLSCVLLDMRMPGMNGGELCSILRSKLLQGMYIFAVSAQALPWEQEEVMRQGFDGLLMKPFREEELIELIHSATEDLFDVPKHARPDLDIVRKMTMGDPSRTAQLLRQFCTDSIQDSKHLTQVINERDLHSTLLLLHRIAGRTAQIGAAELAGDFRTMEIKLRDSGELSAQIAVEANTLIAQLEKLVAWVLHESQQLAEEQIT